MKDRTYYEVKFRDYPDVVTKKEFLTILDNIDPKTAAKLFQDNTVNHFRIGRFYYIPKQSVIDFLVSEEYIQFRKRVEWSRYRFCSDADEKVRRKILLLCEQPQTRRNLMYMLDIPSRKTFIRLYLKPMLESGELQMTIPDHPNISTQRYVRVRKQAIAPL